MTRSIFEPCQQCACTALRRASRAVTHHYETQFRGSGLRVTQFTILSLLAQMKPLPISKLAGLLGMERTTLTRNLGPLERKGLVKFIGDKDARIRRVTITPAGEAAARESLPAWKKAHATVPRLLSKLGLDPNRIGAGIHQI